MCNIQKNRKNKLRFAVIMAVTFLHSTCIFAQTKKDTESFQFAFLTDIHIKPESGAPKAFSIAIDSVNKLKPDFVLTGGDLVFDVMRGNQKRSDSLFNLYKKLSAGFKMPVYNCIGNHELFGIYEESDVDSTHPDYKWGMYERHLGKSWYSFIHKGWKFFVLNSIDVNNKKEYRGVIGEEQMNWIKEELKKTDSSMPIVITVHIPLMSTFHQFYPPSGNGRSPEGIFISNRKEVFEAFSKHNLRLILQGHLHWQEDIHVFGKTRIITGGAVSGFSWKGKRYTEEGFMLFSIQGENISWRYVDYGWEVPTSESSLTGK